MHRLSLSLVSLALLSLRVVAQDATTTYWEPSPPTNTPCSPLELVIARGTGEPGEYGVIVGDPLLNLTQKSIPDVTAYPVNYPANWTLGVSLAIGINDTVEHLLSQTAKCPDQKIVLVGYSQGAAVTHSAVTDSRISTSLLQDKVIAFVVYGDPYNKGGSPAAIHALPDPLQTRMKENCECGDVICSNGTSFNVHVLSYVQPERGYHNVTVDYIKKAYDTNGAQGNQVFTSYDPSNNCTLQYCSNTTLAGAPPHSSGPLGVCAAGGTTPGNGTTSVGTSAPPGSTGTGTPGSPGNSTSPAGTGTGTRPASSTGPTAPTTTGGSTGTGTGSPPPPANSTSPVGTGTAPTRSTVSGMSVPSGSVSLPTGSISLPTGSVSLPTGLPSMSLPSLSLPSLSFPSISWPTIPKASSSKAYRA